MSRRAPLGAGLLLVLLPLLLPAPAALFRGAAAAAAAPATQAAKTAADTAAAAAADADAAPPPLPSWCSAAPYAVGPGADPNLYTSMARGSPSYRVYRNLYMHGNSFYGLLHASDAGDSSFEDGLTTNTVLLRLPVSDVRAFTSNARLCYVSGTTMLLDFPFPTYSGDMRHLAEVLLPAFSVLREGDWGRHAQHRGSPPPAAGAGASPRSSAHQHQAPPSSGAAAAGGGSGGGRGGDDGDAEAVLDNLLLVNMYRHTSDWFRELMYLSTSMATRTGAAPTLIDYADLYYLDKSVWVVFENVLAVQDRYTHPRATSGFLSYDYGHTWKHDGCARYVSPTWTGAAFAQPRHGAELRTLAYVHARLPSPGPWHQGSPPSLPKVITYVRHPDDAQLEVVNSDDVLTMLHEVAAKVGWRVRVSSLSQQAPFAAHLLMASQSGALIGRHGPMLANAMFLAPGALVVELLPYKWEWAGTSRLSFNVTQSMGDVHHYGWRSASWRSAVYANASDVRYHSWTSEECGAKDCLQVHQRAGLIVDVQSVKALLLDKLPKVIAGSPVQELREPWPDAD